MHSRDWLWHAALERAYQVPVTQGVMAGAPKPGAVEAAPAVQAVFHIEPAGTTVSRHRPGGTWQEVEAVQ